MLYEKRSQKTLDNQLFKNPTSEYRGSPFWAWNCELDREELLWQIEQLKTMGFGGFHMHSRSGMATPYLSKDFFGLIKSCVDKAKKEDMYAYLYDEDRWPSGMAGGLVTKDKRYAQRYLRLSVNYDSETVSFEQAKTTGQAYFVCAFDVSLNEKGELIDYKVVFDANEIYKNNTVRWYATVYSSAPLGIYNNQSYVDTLSKEAVDKFIEITHEAYKREIGDEFGKCVPSIFTDEPQFVQKGTLSYAESLDDVRLPWTFDFDTKFKEQYGYSIVEKLPELIWELPEGKISVARYNYHDYVTERFTQAFTDNCGNWCKKNNISLTGHMLAEDSLREQTQHIGEAMRAYRNFEIPGIDVLCDKREFTTAKQAQSAVRQFGCEGMASELYGVTNWDFDFRGYKFQGDWLAALGVTLRIPHLSWVSMKGNAKRDYPASFNYQTSWYKEYKYVENHYARLNTALTRGNPIVNVAVIHPIETYWLHWGPQENTADIREMQDKQFRETAEWLLSGMIDFDYICESLLPDQVGMISDKLQVGKMSYSAIVVSGCETLRSTTVDILEKYHNSGGNIIFVGEPPRYVDAVESDRVKRLYDKCNVIMHSKPQLLKVLEPQRLIDIRNKSGIRTDNLLYQLRQDNDCQWLYVAHMKEEMGTTLLCDGLSNNVAEPFERKIVINGEFNPVLYNTLNGQVEKVNFEIKEGRTYIDYTFFANDSVLLKLCGSTEQLYQTAPSTKKIFKNIRCLDKVAYKLSEENVLLLDIGEFRLDNEEYNEKEEIRRIHDICCERLGFLNNGSQPWLLEKEDIHHFVTIKYEFESEIELENAYLATEDYNDCKIMFNEELIENDVAGYFTDKAIGKIKLPKVQKGINSLEITYPFGQRTSIENCFILGEFNVRCEGCIKTIVPKSEKIGFGDIVSQGLPFYGANITYEMNFEAPECCDAIINVSNYIGAVVKVFLDGEFQGYIAYAPYDIYISNIEYGKHKLEFTLCGNRNNCFGAVHLTDEKFKWFGPPAWRRNFQGGKFETANEFTDFKYEYALKPMGITASPEIKLLK